MTKSTSAAHTGSCLCGGVAYEVSAPLREIFGCHCIQCRKTSGHHVAATSAPRSALAMIRDETLTWYRSSPEAERGFCVRCGGNLFWRPVDGENVSIFVGTLDGATGLAMRKHVFAAFKGDYYGFAAEDEVFERSDSQEAP